MNKVTLCMSDNQTIKWTLENKQYCLHVRSDSNPRSPREDDGGLITTMACWHRSYNLGDKVNASSPEEYWRSLVRENVGEMELYAAAESGKLKGFRVAPNSENPNLVDVYEFYQLRTVLGDSEPSEHLEYEGVAKDGVFYCILDDLTIGNCMALMEPYAEWMPLWLYDHSGITMSCGTRSGQYADQWDSMQVGWIISFKDVIMNNTADFVLDENGEKIRETHIHSNGEKTWSYKVQPLTDDTWRSRAIKIMTDEVELYDHYLTGRVYGFTLYETDVPENEDDKPDWEEIDSCWGFYGWDMIESGLAEYIGCGLEEALASNEYVEGTAKLITFSYYKF